jgi:hypothetical protein
MIIFCLVLLSILGQCLPVKFSMQGVVSRQLKISTEVKLLPSLISSLTSSTNSLFNKAFSTEGFCWDTFNEYMRAQDPRDSQPFKKRRMKYNRVYEPSKSRSSTWFKDYVLNIDGKLNNEASRKAKKFRRRFRLPYASFLKLIAEIRTDNWFPLAENNNAVGQVGVPLELLVLGTLRYMGRGWTFDDLEESSGISEETHRLFSHKFWDCGKNHLFQKWVKTPESQSEIEDTMSEYAAAGFEGCVGSTDATHVVIEKCYQNLKNQNLGGKSSQTTRGFILLYIIIHI